MDLKDLYNPKKIYAHIFLKRSLIVPDFDLVDQSIRTSSTINFFRLYGVSGFSNIKNEFNKLLKKSGKSRQSN